MQIEIQIPKAVLFDVKYTVEQATNFAKKEVALGFYMQKGVSVSLCSQIAGMSQKEFLVEVKDRKQFLTNLLKKSMIKSNRTTETCEACSLEGFFGNLSLYMVKS